MAETIVLTVLWSANAKRTYGKIIDYLAESWSKKEIGNLLDRTEKLITVLQQYPEMGRPSVKRRGVRIILLDKHTQMVYYYKPIKKQIILLHFWGMKQNPAKFRY